MTAPTNRAAPPRVFCARLAGIAVFDPNGDLVGRVRDTLLPGGTVVLVHWTGLTHYPLSGDGAATLFIAESRSFLHPVHHAATDAYRLDVLTRSDGESA